MAIKFSTTRKSSKYCKVVVYGRTGRGKTRLCRTAPTPIIITSENKLMSIREDNIPIIEVTTVEELQEAVNFIESSREAKKFETICVDSITDIAETMLSQYKRKYADPRNAYGDLADFMGEAIRRLRDVKKKHLYCIAKAKRITGGDADTQWIASMPGTQLVTNLPYWFDFVFPFRIQEGDDEDETWTYLQTVADYKYDAKDSSGNLDPMEEPHLDKLFKKALKTPKKKK